MLDSIASLHAVLFLVADHCEEYVLHNLSLVSKSYYRRVRESTTVALLYEWRKTTPLLHMAASYELIGNYYYNAYGVRLACWDSRERPEQG